MINVTRAVRQRAVVQSCDAPKFAELAVFADVALWGTEKMEDATNQTNAQQRHQRHQMCAQQTNLTLHVELDAKQLAITKNHWFAPQSVLLAVFAKNHSLELRTVHVFSKKTVHQNVDQTKSTQHASMVAWHAMFSSTVGHVTLCPHLIAEKDVLASPVTEQTVQATACDQKIVLDHLMTHLSNEIEIEFSCQIWNKNISQISVTTVVFLSTNNVRFSVQTVAYTVFRDILF